VSKGLETPGSRPESASGAEITSPRRPNAPAAAAEAGSCTDQCLRRVQSASLMSVMDQQAEALLWQIEHQIAAQECLKERAKGARKKSKDLDDYGDECLEAFGAAA